jgi:3-hydroxybutyryl-CoA dehydrogenase
MPHTPVSSSIAVIGCGTLGSQIAFTLAALGNYKVKIFDKNFQAAQQAREKMHGWISSIRSEGGPAIDEARLSDLLTMSNSLEEAVSDVELIIEAIPEDLAMKRDLFARMSLLTRNTILATNSSSIKSRYLADLTENPQRLLNAHFYLEPWKRNPVELMSCGQTDPGVMLRTAEILKAAKLDPTLLQKESTGLLFNRIWRAVKRECLRVIAEDVGRPEEIDKMWRVNFDAPMGPCQMMDAIGLDVVLAIERIYAAESSDPTDVPPAFLEELVRNGKLGKKAGEGLYRYYSGHPGTTSAISPKTVKLSATF